MPIRMPDPEQVGLVMPQADRPIASYRGGIAQEAQESTGEGAARVGQGLASAGADFANAQDQVQSAAAYSSFLQQKLQLDQQFQSDTDYTTSAQRYGDAVQKAAESAGSGIRNVQMRTQFMERVGRMQEFGMELQGPYSQLMHDSKYAIPGDWQYSFLRSRAGTIYSGTSEIQRNIIGERVLGLPKG